jgi:predicted component of type VI protein secretion system
MSTQSGIPGVTTREIQSSEATPFVIGVVGGLGVVTPRPRLRDTRFVAVNASTFATFFARVGPRITPQPELGIQKELRFTSVEDFTPEGLSRLLAQHSINAASAASIADRLWTESGFQQLRATWTGLKFLLDSTAGLANVKVKFLDCFKKEALRDLQRAAEFDQSVLYKKIVEHELGTFGGEPFGCIVFDYWLSDSGNDIDLAHELTQVAAAATVPFLLGVGPGFFPVTEWADLNPEFSISWMLEAHRARLSSFRDSNDAAFSFGFLPRIASPAANEGTAEPCWINSAFLAAAIAAQVFQEQDLPKIARRLFASTDAIGQPLSIVSEVAFDWSCPEPLALRLRQAGLNLLTSYTRSDTLLRDAVPLAGCGKDGSVESLALAILIGQLRMRLNSYVRWKRNSDSSESFCNAAQEWIDKLPSRKDPGLDDLPFEFASMDRSNGGVQIRFNLLLGDAKGDQRRGFTIQVSTPHPRRLSEPTANDLSAPKTLRVVAFLDLPDTPPDADPTLPLTQREMFHDAISEPSIRIAAIGAEPESRFGTTLRVRRFCPLKLDEVIKQVPLLTQLVADRVQLLNVASYANVSLARNGTLVELLDQPGIFPARQINVDGWPSALASCPEAPVCSEEASRSLVISKVRDWDLAPLDIEKALQTCAEWAARGAKKSGCTGWQSLCSGIDVMDDLIARTVVEIYRHPVLHNLESAKEALLQLLASLPPAARLEVSPFGLTASGGNDRFLKYSLSPHPTRDILVLEITEPGEAEIENLQRLLELDRVQSTVVLVGVRDCPITNLPISLRALAEFPCATNLVICAANIEVPRRSSTIVSHLVSQSLVPLLPPLTSTGVYRVAEELVRNQDEVFRENGVSMELSANGLREIGWQILSFGQALLLSSS